MIKSKSISRRILAVMLAAVTVIAFTPAIAFTQSAHAGTANSTITVGGVPFTTDASGNTVYGTTNSGAVTNTGSTSTNYNIMWDGSTLTLNNATISGVSGSYNGAGIFYTGTAVTIDAEGNNTITGGNCNSGGVHRYAFGLFCNGAMTFMGTGSLQVTAGTADSSGDSAGIKCNSGKLIVTGGTLKGTGGYAKDGDSIGIDCGSLSVSGGTVKGTGGEGKTKSKGIAANNNSSITGGTVEGIGGTSDGEGSYGFYDQYGSITVTGGSLKAIGGTAKTSGQISSGICLGSKDEISVDGGTVELAGNNNYLQGNSVSGKVKLGDGVTAYTAPNADGTGYQTPYTSENPSTDKYFKSPYTAPAPVAYPPTVTTQPTGGSYDIGGKVTPLKVATSDSGAKYQWQQSTDGTNWTNIDGATNPTYTPSVSASGSTKYRCFITGSNGASTYSDAVTITVSKRYAVGAKFTKAPLIYKVTKQPALKTTSASKNGTVKVVKPVKKTYKSITVPTSVKMNGYTYNVTTIGKKAFYKNSKLKTVTIKSTKITSIGSKAFKGCKKAMTIKVPKSKYKAYKKLLKGKVPAGTKIKKI